ncbi:MAG: flagellar hook-associated protein FlgK [Aliishimia sp.]
MTIASAFQNAMSGLRAAGHATDVIASNISNANTPGYARRVLELSSTSLSNSGGVTVSGITRMVDPGLIAARRSAQADFGFSQIISDFTSSFESALGTPDDPRALTNLIADFDASLLSASSRPDAPERLDVAIDAARTLVQAINESSNSVSDMRSAADGSIDAQVTRLNAALEEVKYLNIQISEIRISGQDDSAMIDLRQVLIDEIYEIVPVHQSSRENGKVALYTEGGIVLLDGNAAEVSFSPTRTVTPYMTLSGGHLSGLTVNGNSINVGSENSDVPGGTLAAQFAIRDELGEDALLQLDATARNLVERFQDPTVDSTLLAGDAGLFTDQGAAFDALDEVGLAERLMLNSSVDPSQGGEAWRLRDGLGAVTSGPTGQAALLDTLRDTLNEREVPASGDFGTGALSLSDLANGLMGRVGVQRLSADQSLSFTSAALHETSQAERADGVDTDTELQNLILVEQNYAANARMIETINRMMDTLMGLGA